MLPKFLTKTKIAIFLLTFLILFSSVSKTVMAFSGPTYRGGYYFNFENAVFKTEEMNLQSFVNETVKATVSSIITAVAGCYSCDAEERQKFPGLLFAAGHMIVGLYASPPASGVQYLADLGRQFGIVRPVYAQEEGMGFAAMKVIQPIWTAFRNISYVFFVLILIFMGFAIMFRVKISPQTVISLQSALPKIVLALILITFSYAIVGLMLDLMYVFMALISEIFIGDNGVIQTIGGLAGVIADLSNWVGSLFGSNVIFGQSLANGLFFTLAGLVSFIVALLIGPVGWLLAIIAIILILIAVLRCLWTILKAYAMIIVSLIFAPLQILIGVLPGSNAIGSWFRSLLGNIAVLPAILMMFYVADYLMLSGIAAIFTDPVLLLSTILTGWTGVLGAPIASVAILVGGVETFWQFFSAIILPIIGLMVLLMAPKVSDMIKSFLAGKPFEYGAAIGEAFGPVSTAAGVGIAGGLGYGAGELTTKASVQARPWLQKLIEESAAAAQKRVLSK